MCKSTYPLLYTPRHPENFDFRAFRSGVSQNRNSWGSSIYQGVMNPLDHPDDKAVWGKPRFWVSGRLPQIFMVANHFPLRPKMKILAMTKCISTISGKARYCRNFLLSPPNFTVYKNKSACQGFREPDRPTSFLLRSGYCPPNSIR